MGQHGSSPAGSQVHSSDEGSVITSLTMVSNTLTHLHVALVTSTTPYTLFYVGHTSTGDECISTEQGFVQSLLLPP